MAEPRKYTTLALPNDLIQRLDRFIATNDWGYRSRGEVATVALREFLLRHEAEAKVKGPAKSKP